MRNRFEGVDLSSSKSIQRIVRNARLKINEVLEEHAKLVEGVSPEAAKILRDQKEDV